MKFNSKTIIFYLICILITFLPLSSWLISLTGMASLTLVRDVLILIMAFLTVFTIDLKKGNKTICWLVFAFIAWGVLSFFWREASAMQWLKGFRFTFLPIIFFLSLLHYEFNDIQKKVIFRLILAGAIVILAFAALSLCGINIPLTTSLSGQGALESVHYVGNSTIPRLQSILAGPNALGLYLLAILGLVAANLKEKKSIRVLLWPVVLILFLTFSRSAFIGALVVALLTIFLALKDKIGALKSALAVIGISIVIALAGFIAYKSPSLQNYFTHDNSSSLRYEQYQRIWETKSEIGLLGRGSGTAGPSSQSRLDGGVNHWTENIYLDIFEELGFIGLSLYLVLIGALIYSTYKRGNKSAFLILTAFAVTGIFINYYTGQVGIFLMWLTAVLALNDKGKDDSKE
jgi:hypothetical protein